MSATTIIINDETPRRQYTASAGQTVFDFPFPFFADGDLEVYLTPNGSQPNDTTDIQTIVTDYTVTGADTQNGGKITLTSGASAGDIITILRVVDIDRTADYQAAGDLLAETLNAEQDTEIMISQQLREEANRAIRSQKSDVTVDMTLPSAADRADTLLQFDVNGEPGVISTTALVSSLSGAILGANYVTNTAVGDGSTVNFTVSVAPGAKGNIQIYIDGVYQNKSSFSISGTTITFTEAPPLNASVEFIIGYSIGSVGNDAGDITYTPAGTGALTTDVEAKLREFVSVKDFGAVGDGVTDDTAAFTAAFNEAQTSGAQLVVPNGTYKITDSSAFPDQSNAIVPVSVLFGANVVITGDLTPSTWGQIPCFGHTKANTYNLINNNYRFSAPNFAIEDPGSPGDYPFGIATDITEIAPGTAFRGNANASFAHVTGKSGADCAIGAINMVTRLESGFLGNGNGTEIDIDNYVGNVKGLGAVITGVGNYTCDSGVKVTRGDSTSPWTYGVKVEKSKFGVHVDLSDEPSPTHAAYFTGMSSDLVKLTPKDDLTTTNALIYATASDGSSTKWRVNKDGSTTQTSYVEATEVRLTKPASPSVIWLSGSGSPEGSSTANVGSIYSRTDGGASTTLYVKESGTGNTGWVAK
jgi:hypothetical protein